MDTLRRTTFAAVASSFMLMCLLLLFVIIVVKQPRAEAKPLVMLAAVFVFTYLTIFRWMRCARMYIDYAIDRKLAPAANGKLGTAPRPSLPARRFTGKRLGGPFFLEIPLYILVGVALQ